MGYTTSFMGAFGITPPLSAAHRDYLKELNNTRRMQRDPEKTKKYPDPLREAVGLPLGEEGEYYVGANIPGEHWTANGIQMDPLAGYGQVHSPDILDYNASPGEQPGLWLHWIPSDDGTQILWDEGEKFYEYTSWLTYLLERFLVPWGYKVNGTVEWQGEDQDDRGRMIVEDNVLRTQHAEIQWVDD